MIKQTSQIDGLEKCMSAKGKKSQEKAVPVYAKLIAGVIVGFLVFSTVVGTLMLILA